jgi:hypothetical protein
VQDSYSCPEGMKVLSKGRQYSHFLLGWNPSSQALSMSCLFLSHALSSGVLKVVVICHSSISFVWERGKKLEKNDCSLEKNFFCSLFRLVWFRHQFSPSSGCQWLLCLQPACMTHHFLSLHVPLKCWYLHTRLLLQPGRPQSIVY